MKPCVIECELGSLQITTLEIIDFRVGKRLFSVAGDYFEQGDPNKKIVSPRFKELANSWVCGTPSYRNVADALNRIRLEPIGINPTWLRDNVEKDGQKMSKALHEQAEYVLEANGFDKEGNLQPETIIEPAIVTETDEAKAQELEAALKTAADKFNIEGKINTSDFEDPETTVNISIDDVLSNRQATSRPDSPEKGERKYVTNTVVHVEQQNNSYVICDACIKGALSLIMGFLVANGLIGMPLFVFFIDGASDLRGPIEALFAPFNFKIILDWFHLIQKVEQRLSSGMKNYKLRHVFEDEVLKPLLWLGDVSGAIACLKSIPEEAIRSKENITKLIEYLIRNQNYIPCYALRHEIGLRNSSNRVEKANDQVVSARQKNNGMSWSYEGSRGLASVTTTWKNDELKGWCMDGNLRFTFSELKEAS